jgi:pilus assembly protein Flp/PilA
MAQDRKQPSKLQRLIKDQQGAGMTEYIILVGVIALLAIAAFQFFGDQVREKVEAQGDTVTNDINAESGL